jgi:hypothetical protein
VKGIRWDFLIFAGMREIMWSIRMRLQNLKIELMFGAKLSLFPFYMGQKGIPAMLVVTVKVYSISGPWGPVIRRTGSAGKR